jgi:hypothetical protein
MAPASQVVLGSSFQPIGAGGFLASGDYVLRSTVNNGFPWETGWIVINNRLGTTTALDPQCRVVGFGPPWVLMSCPLASNPSGPFDSELFSLADGTRETVTPNPGLPQCPPQPGPQDECANAVGVGAYWIRWDVTCSHDCPITYFFQNILTGALRDDPTNATTFADLNSPALAHRTCRGVQLMRNLDSLGMGWGSLTLDGQFALATGTDSDVFLERCGTRMRRLLGDGNVVAWVSNGGAIVWQALTSRQDRLVLPRQLNGLFLPGLQTFRIPLPSAIVRPPGSLEDTIVAGLELTSDALYVREGWAGTLWRTASPAAFPRNTSQPRVTRSGSNLTCGRGNWRNAARFFYAWRVNGTARKDANPTLAVGKSRKRRRVSCSVTASNAAGTTTASSAQLPLR